MATNKGRVFFGLVGYHFNPDDVTRLIGLEPTATDNAGAQSGLDKPVISSWELSSDTFTSDEEELDLYKIGDKLLKIIEPAKDKIIEVCKSHNLSPRISIVLTLSVDKDEDSPEVGFGARMIRFAADIGAFLNIDYELSERI